MRPFRAVRRPTAEWCGPLWPDSEKWVGKPITVDLDSVHVGGCGARQWYVVGGAMGCAVCEHVVAIGD